MMEPVPTEEEERGELARWARNDEVARKRERKKVRARVDSGVRRRGGKSLRSGMGKRVRWAEPVVEVDIDAGCGCPGESDYHQCWIDGLVNPVEPASDHLLMESRVVCRHAGPLKTSHGADDVWTQLGKE
jgi:hypothetical protein